MRPIDADALVAKLNLIFGHNDFFDETDESWEQAFKVGVAHAVKEINHAETIAKLSNNPLTLEKLQKMGGEKVVLHSALHGEGAYEAFQKIASEFYRDSTYKFAVLSLDADPQPGSVEFTAEFWSVPAGAENESPNDPLTLEQLREMAQRCDGVYVAHMDGSPVFRDQEYCAAVLDFSPAFGSTVMHIHAIYGDGLTMWEDDYGQTWLAYRRKPEEGTA